MAQRRRKRKRKKSARARLWIVIVVALVIAGFLARRIMMPRAVHYLAYRPVAGATRPESSPGSGPSEHLTASDRQHVDDLMKRDAR